MHNKILAHLGLLIANLIYALNYTLAKDVMPEYIQPSGFILLRVIGGVFLFGLSYSLFIQEKINKPDLLLFGICGFFGVAVNQLLFFEGLNLTTPINAAIIMTSTPILVILLSTFILNESITLRKILGIFLGLFGAVILILNGGDFTTNTNYMQGNFFILMNATSYAFYLVLIKPLMLKYHPITVMTLVFSFGLIFVFPFGLEELFIIEWEIMPEKIVLKILFVVICTTFFAYLFNSAALKYVMPSTVSIYIYLQPLFATVIAVLLQSDRLDSIKIISSLFIFLGIYLVSFKPQKKKYNLF
ncbi:MAG: DMT family transporter [Bacteroidota bacterium]|nr:DMT family transporter [Bacteroidota bacterium]